MRQGRVPVPRVTGSRTRSIAGKLYIGRVAGFVQRIFKIFWMSESLA